MGLNSIRLAINNPHETQNLTSGVNTGNEALLDAMNTYQAKRNHSLLSEGPNKPIICTLINWGKSHKLNEWVKKGKKHKG